MGRWVGGPEVTLEGRDERLVLGLPSSSWRSEEEDEDAAGPRLLRCEMRAFLGANGSMKSKSGWRFCGNTSRTELKISHFTKGRQQVDDAIPERPLRHRIRETSPKGLTSVLAPRFDDFGPTFTCVLHGLGHAFPGLTLPSQGDQSLSRHISSQGRVPPAVLW
ncbi:hypothetical protein INR49_012572 [Caranx melampygus]|nr:hypothetical protein INR49_012572 [Caranx melampygus]